MVSIWPSLIYVGTVLIGSGILIAGNRGEQILMSIPLYFLLWWGGFFDPILKALL